MQSNLSFIHIELHLVFNFQVPVDGFQKQPVLRYKPIVEVSADVIENCKETSHM